MNKLVLSLGLGGLLLVGAELLVGKLGPQGNRSVSEVVVEREGVRGLRPELDVWVASSRLETDEHGQRRLGGEDRTDADGAFQILVAGARFGAALGTDAEVHFAASLQRELREVFGLASAQVHLSLTLGPLEARCRRIRERAATLEPDCVLLQFEPSDFGVDEAPFVEPAESDHAVWAGPRDGPSALLRAVSHWRERRDRRVVEDHVRELVSRDGLCSRASENARRRFVQFQREIEEDPRSSPRFRAQARESFDPVRREARETDAALIEALLSDLQSAGCRPMVMLVGPDSLLGSARDAARALGLPTVSGPPTHLDPELRVGRPARPADLVHERWAQVLAAALEDEGYLPVDLEPADADRHRQAEEVLREVRSFHGRHEGHKLEELRHVVSGVPSSLDLEGAPSPWVFAGLEEGGALSGSELRFVLRAATAEFRLELEVEGPAPPPFQAEWGGIDCPASEWTRSASGTWTAAVEAPAGLNRLLAAPLRLRWSSEATGHHLRRCALR